MVSREMEKVLALSLACLGVQVERMEETDTSIIFTASIPETLDSAIVPERIQKRENAHNLPGTTILHGLEALFSQHAEKRCFFNCAIRVGEVWTKEMCVRADLEMKARFHTIENGG